MSIEFSDLAKYGLLRIDSDKRATIEYAIRFYLKDPLAIFKSRRCEAFDDLDLYILPIEEVRVLFEVEGNLTQVWSVYPQQKGETAATP